MATAIESGLNRHWSGSLLDLTSGGLSAGSCQEKKKQSCDILLNLGWQRQSSEPITSRFCDNDSFLQEVSSWRSQVGATENRTGASNTTVNSCGDASLLLGLFEAINNKKYQESTLKNNTLPYSSELTSKLPAGTINSACLSNCPEVSKLGLHTSYNRRPMNNPLESTKRLRRRHCHSESELSPQVAFGNGSLSNSVTNFFSLITLTSCFDGTGGQETTLFTLDTHDSPEKDVAQDLIEPEKPGREDHVESPVGCSELVQHAPNETSSVTEEQTTPSATLPVTTENTPDSPLSEPLTLSQECLDYLSCQNDSPTNQTLTSPTSSLSNRSSSTKLVKSVSFADDMGKSLTQIFEFDSTGDKWPDYHADVYGDALDRTLYGVLRKPKREDKFYPDRFTRSRVRHRNYDYHTDNRFSSACQEVDRYSDHDTRAVASRADRKVPVYVWNITFPQPATKYYEFRQKVENNAVSLESISMVNSENTSDNQQLPNLSGTVKVLNLAFLKQVWLRITVDNWQTFTEHQATYSQLLSGGHLQTSTRFDTFTFQVSASSLLEPLVSPDQVEQVSKIEFAIRYAVDNGDKQFWDSNDGKNYAIERSQEMASSTTATGGNLSSRWMHHSSSSSRHDGPTSFYFSDHHTTVQDVGDPYTAEYLPNFSGITSFTNYRVWNHFVDETVYY